MRKKAKSIGSPAVASIASATLGWYLRSQAIAFSKVFMVESGWSLWSATMPTECAPDDSGISQTQ